MTKKALVTCPTCGKKDTWKKDNLFKPFCSDRCKLIDLGQWADESYRVPSEPIDPEQIPGDEKED